MDALKNELLFSYIELINAQKIESQINIVHITIRTARCNKTLSSKSSIYKIFFLRFYDSDAYRLLVSGIRGLDLSPDLTTSTSEIASKSR